MYWNFGTTLGHFANFGHSWVVAAGAVGYMTWVRYFGCGRPAWRGDYWDLSGCCMPADRLGLAVVGSPGGFGLLGILDGIPGTLGNRYIVARQTVWEKTADS